MDPVTIVLILTVLLVAAAVVLVLRHRRGATRGTGTALPRLVAGLCIVGAMLSVVGGLIGIVQALVSGTVLLPVPVITTVEEVPAELRADPGASINGVTQQTSLLLSVAGLDAPARALTALSHLLTAAVAVTLLVVVARLAQQSMADAPFSPRLGRLLVIGGATLALGGTAAQVASTIAGRFAHAQLFALREGAAVDSTYIPPAWMIETWPIAVGVALIVVAGLITRGERLQRDTAGLV